MTYPEAIDYLNSLVNYEKIDGYDYSSSFKLDRMKRLCAFLGDPQASVNAIHVAGSKGKGSTAAMIHSILLQAGFRSALYTSPHLVSYRERIRIGNELIAEDDLARLLERVALASDRLGEKPTFFEACTAAAYLYFNEAKADIAVYEVGLGGRLDATNVIEPLVSVITPLSYEHTHILGTTLAAIAREKAGIIKTNSICVSAPQENEALEVIEETCSQKNAKLILAGRDITFRELASGQNGEVFTVEGMAGDYDCLETRLLGPHQVVNAAVAIAAVEALGIYGVAVGSDAVRRGIAGTAWSGRLEVVSRRPLIVLDGAQNRASARALAVAARKIFSYKKLILILGVSKDKDVHGIVKELLPLAGQIILTKSKIADRAMEPPRIRSAIGAARVAVSETGGIEEALALARRAASAEDLILVAGSLFLAGEARQILIGDTVCMLQG